MVRHITLLALTLGLTLPATDSLAADAADRRRAALLMLEAAAPDALVRQLAAEPVQVLMRNSHAVRPELRQDELFALSALYLDEMQAAARLALSDRATALANRYALDELEALRRFAATDEGRAALSEADGPISGLEASISAEMLDRMDEAFDRHGRDR